MKRDRVSGLSDINCFTYSFGTEHSVLTGSSDFAPDALISQAEELPAVRLIAVSTHAITTFEL